VGPIYEGKVDWSNPFGTYGDSSLNPLRHQMCTKTEQIVETADNTNKQ